MIINICGFVMSGFVDLNNKLSSSLEAKEEILASNSEDASVIKTEALALKISKIAPSSELRAKDLTVHEWSPVSSSSESPVSDLAVSPEISSSPPPTSMEELKLSWSSNKPRRRCFDVERRRAEERSRPPHPLLASWQTFKTTSLPDIPKEESTAKRPIAQQEAPGTPVSRTANAVIQAGKALYEHKSVLIGSASVGLGTVGIVSASGPLAVGVAIMGTAAAATGLGAHLVGKCFDWSIAKIEDAIAPLDQEIHRLMDEASCAENDLAIQQLLNERGRLSKEYNEYNRNKQSCSRVETAASFVGVLTLVGSAAAIPEVTLIAADAVGNVANALTFVDGGMTAHSIVLEEKQEERSSQIAK